MTVDGINMRADDGKMLVRKSDGSIMGDRLCLGDHDSADNYEEREFTSEESAAFWESIGMEDPKVRREAPRREIRGAEKGVRHAA